jgi:hypothetical protein
MWADLGEGIVDRSPAVGSDARRRAAAVVTRCHDNG